MTEGIVRLIVSLRIFFVHWNHVELGDESAIPGFGVKYKTDTILVKEEVEEGHQNTDTNTSVILQETGGE